MFVRTDAGKTWRKCDQGASDSDWLSVASWTYVALALIMGCILAFAAGTAFGDPPQLSAAAQKALTAAKKRHGLPPGVPIPSWVSKEGTSAYLMPPGTAFAKGGPIHNPFGRTQLSQQERPDEPPTPPGLENAPGPDPAPNELGLRCTGSYCPPPPLRYFGGPVQHEPTVHVIFWGSNWNTTGAAARAQILKLFEGLSGSAYQEVLNQYFDSSGWISPTVTVDSYTDTSVTAPTNVTYESLVEEMDNQIGGAGKHWPESARTANAQFAVIPAPGTTYNAEFTGFCAYHSYDSHGTAYTAVPYAGDPPFSTEDGCQGYYGKGDATKATSLMASHEYAEAATDPKWDVEPAWKDNEGYELSDMCATPYDELPNGTFVQGQYDDHQSACSLSDPKPPHVLALTEPGTNVGKHSATINATVNPEGSETTYYFEWGPTTSYGTLLPAKGASVGSGKANVKVSQSLTGLELEHVYHYRVVATNSTGTTYGEDMTVYPSKWLKHSLSRGSEWTGDELKAVSCSSATTCMAVGDYRDLSFVSTGAEVNRMLSFEMNGEEWTQRSVPEVANEAWPELYSVSCTSANACTAAGTAWNTTTEHWMPTAFRWNGSSWAAQSVPLPKGAIEGQFRGVSCPSSSECLAVGYIESAANVWEDLAMRWSGGAWSLLSTPTEIPVESFGELVDISCSSPSQCVAVGWHNGTETSGDILAWNGTEWTSQKASSSNAVLWGVSCTSSTFCVAADYRGKLEMWDGTKWTTNNGAELSDVSSAGFEHVSCVTASSCTATGVGWSKRNGIGVALVEVWNGSKWTEQTTPRESEFIENGFAGVSCWDLGHCVTTGYSRVSGQLTSLAETRRSLNLTATYSSSVTGSGEHALKDPEGAAIDSSGNLYVADSENNRVEKFNSKGEWVLSFGSLGTEAGKFKKPADIAIAPSGNLYVADSENCRVEEFEPSGKFVTAFGSCGTNENGKFTETWGVAVAADGEVWVTDHRYNRIEEFTGSGTFIRSVGNGVGETELGGPTGIAIGPDGRIYVADAGDRQVRVLTSAGSDLFHFGSEGEGNGQFQLPRGIAVMRSGNILVSDRSARVEEFSPGGEFETEFGKEGTGAGQFREPNDIVMAKGGAFYIVDRINNRVQKWIQPEAPEVTTEAASGVNVSVATLNAAINPCGATTTYHFQYTTAASYESVGYAGAVSVPIPDESAGSGTENINENRELSGLKTGTTYHFRIVASNENGTSIGEDKTFKTEPSTPERLAGMDLTDPFNSSTSTISNFGTNWSALGWASGSVPKGEDTSSGWRPSAAYPTTNGAYFAPVVSDSGSGSAAEVTMATNPGSAAGKYFSVWLDQATAGSTRNGYELRFTVTAANTYTVALSKWVSGVQTSLASQGGVTFNNGNSLALVDQGSTVSAWTNPGSGFGQLLSASDSSFSSGTSAVEGSGNITRLTNFKVGQLLAPATNMDGALKSLALNDSFSTTESPLSEGGTWAALAWDSVSAHNTGRVEGGWGPYDSYSSINGAYWTKATFADTGSGDAVAATLKANPATTPGRYFALWLNASNPGSVKSGYEERFTETSTGIYEVVLAKWVSGTKTALATKAGYSFPVNSQFGLVDKNGTVSAWTSTGTEYTQLLSASDSTYTSGYTGVEGSGNVTRLTNFRSGPLAPF